VLQTADHRLVPRGAQPQLTASGSALPESSAEALPDASPDASHDALPQASVHVLVPAHDEEASIGATLASLRQQTLRPVSITVLADNCSDHTAGAALIEGAAVYPTVGNTDHKAGALNQYLRRNLLSMDPDHFILVLDADSTLDPRFLETAIRRMTADRRIGAVGGVVLSNEPRTLVEQAQVNEYARFARAVARKQGQVLVLTGSATIYRVTALLQVAEQRERRLPGRMGDSYDIAARTQDNEITLALKHLGWRLVSPQECTARTELMPTLGDLHRQRLRWYRGAIENLRRYGWTTVTSRYWVQQIGLLLCTLVVGLFVAITAIELSLGLLRWSPVWPAVALLFLVERLVTVWPVGTRRGRLLALGLVPEIAYDLFLQATFVRAAFQVVRGVDRSRRPSPARLHRA
jgi:poly-beta-1,6-N-acetyl-D-glucosamine synthase